MFRRCNKALFQSTPLDTNFKKGWADIRRLAQFPTTHKILCVLLCANLSGPAVQLSDLVIEARINDQDPATGSLVQFHKSAGMAPSLGRLARSQKPTTSRRALYPHACIPLPFNSFFFLDKDTARA